MPEDEKRVGRSPLGCDHCGSAWLGEPESPCALCAVGTLHPRSVRIEGQPELAKPFGLSPDEAREKVAAYVARQLMPVADAQRACERLVPHFVPAWLVDAHVEAAWEAEIGFDYEVESTVERNRGGRWESIPRKERRIRWEPRAGTVDRWYDNAPVPALSTWPAWEAVVGEMSRKGAVQIRDDAPILLPDQPPEVAWLAAEVALKQRVGADVARASAGQHARELYVLAHYGAVTWTWLLFPVYAAAYTDDAGVVRVLRVDGVTGAVTGAVAASPAKARIRALLWVSTGLALLAVAAVVAVPGIVLWPLLLLTALAAIVGFVLLGVAVVPVLRVRAVNAALSESDPVWPTASP